MWNDAWPQPAAVAKALDPNRYFWQPLGNYPATVVNPQMGASVQMGVQEMIRLVTQVFPKGNPVGDGIVLLGYSQGALVVDIFMRDHVVNPAGECHDRYEDIVCVAVWGNPMRVPNFASGNEFAGWPLPAPVDGLPTGGIAGTGNLSMADVRPYSKTVRHYWGDFVNTIGQGNDLYADCPQGGPGVYEEQVYNLVQNADLTNFWAFVADLMQLATSMGAQFQMIWNIAEAIINGVLFLGAGANASHYTYDLTPIINFVNVCGQETPPYGN